MMRAIALQAGGWQGGGMNMPPAPDDGLLLENRAGLPEEFSLVLTGMPRAAWDAHPDFNGLAAFWLDRHLAFRRMLDALGADVRARIDGGMAAEVHAARCRGWAHACWGTSWGITRSKTTSISPNSPG
jgi:hypothetical protein